MSITDWPDWMPAPATDYIPFSEDVVSAPGQVLAHIELGRFACGALLLQADGDGKDYAVALQFVDRAEGEGPSIIEQQIIVRLWTQGVVVPFNCWAPYLRVVSQWCTAYPHNAFGVIGLYGSQGALTGFPGGVMSLYYNDNIATATPLVLRPSGVAPGLHEVAIDTDAAAWTLKQRLYGELLTPLDFPICDQTTAPEGRYKFMSPASGWEFVWEQTDGVNRDIAITCSRQP